MASYTQRVMLVDSQPVFLEGLQQLIAGLQDFAVVAMATSLSEAMGNFLLVRPDFVVCDLQLRGVSTEKLLEMAICADWKPPVLIASSSHNRDDVLRAIEAGASGYLTKSATREEFVTALIKLSAGQNYLHPEVAHIVFKKMRSAGAEVHSPVLTGREKQLLDLLGQGLQPKAIAEHLHLAPSTVKTHLRSLFRKFQVNSRTQLVLKAVNTGIFEVKV
ncbi:response regulator transcription factor [bacterium]|nr:response regulator transcription factor [bacterium]